MVDMCNASDQEMGELCAKEKYYEGGRYRNEDEMVLSPNFNKEEIDDFVSAIKIGIKSQPR